MLSCWPCVCILSLFWPCFVSLLCNGLCVPVWRNSTWRVHYWYYPRHLFKIKLTSSQFLPSPHPAANMPHKFIKAIFFPVPPPQQTFSLMCNLQVIFWHPPLPNTMYLCIHNNPASQSVPLPPQKSTQKKLKKKERERKKKRERERERKEEEVNAAWCFPFLGCMYQRVSNVSSHFFIFFFLSCDVYVTNAESCFCFQTHQSTSQ